MNKFELLAEQFIIECAKNSWLDSQQKTHPRDKCEMAGCKKCDYTELDFQQKSGGKKKIELLGEPWIEEKADSRTYHPTLKELVDKLNELIKDRNENL